jgi:hypothetical protein
MDGWMERKKEYILPWKIEQYIASKCMYQSTKLYGVISFKTTTFSEAVRDRHPNHLACAAMHICHQSYVSTHVQLLFFRQPATPLLAVNQSNMQEN